MLKFLFKTKFLFKARQNSYPSTTMNREIIHLIVTRINKHLLSFVQICYPIAILENQYCPPSHHIWPNWKDRKPFIYNSFHLPLNKFPADSEYEEEYEENLKSLEGWFRQENKLIYYHSDKENPTVIPWHKWVNRGFVLLMKENYDNSEVWWKSYKLLHKLMWQKLIGWMKIHTN